MAASRVGAIADRGHAITWPATEAPDSRLGDMRTFDVVVVGGGPAGEEAAGRLAGHGLDVSAVLAGRDEVIAHFDDATPAGWLEGRGVVLVRGRGRLAGERRVIVGD